MNWRTFIDVLNNSEIVSCTMRNRDYSLDLIRVIACLMIVLMHSPMSGLGTSGFVLCGVSYFTAPGFRKVNDVVGLESKLQVNLE